MTNNALCYYRAMNRRHFLQVLGVAAAQPVLSAAVAQTSPAWKVGGFTKPIQDLSFEETARVAVDIGWDGIELALRAGGHVLPERVEEDLPKIVSALRARNREVLVLATDIRSADPLAARVLRAAANQGIKLYRLGMLQYRGDTPIAQQVKNFRPQLKELAALNRQLGVTGLLQNHSGNGYVGAAVWDIHALIDDIDPRELGVHFDIGHATVESGLSWPTTFALVKDRVGAVIVKDFYWKLTPGAGSTTEWCPIGRGTISPKFFPLLRASGFRGPITMQFEYPFDNPSIEARVRALKADNAQLRAWLKAV
jgi:sugar phosphate isomerase/epimerase